MRGDARNPHPPLPRILHRLLQSGARWLAAEVAEGRADARLVTRSIMRGIIIGVVGFVLLLAGVMLMVESLALVAGSYLGSEAGGHAATGAACLVLAAIAAGFATHAVKVGPHLHSRAALWLLGKSHRRT